MFFDLCLNLLGLLCTVIFIGAIAIAITWVISLIYILFSAGKSVANEERKKKHDD